MTTAFDVLGHNYRLHQATRFDCMYEITGEMTLVAVCSPEYGCYMARTSTSYATILWHGDSRVSCHVANDTAGMFNCSRIHSYIKIGNAKYMYSSRIGKKEGHDNTSKRFNIGFDSV
jgi:hypothetical protein